MTVLLIQIPYWSTEPEKHAIKCIVMPSLGMGYLASTLIYNNIKTTIIDLNVESEQILFEQLETQQPQIIGISCYTFNSSQLKRLIPKIKNTLPIAKIIVGGVYASYDYRFLLKTHAIDFIVRFEGEHAFLSLCQEILSQSNKFRSLNNLAYIEDYELVTTKIAEPISDLDKIPFPQLDANKYPTKEIPIITSRGCAFHCIYCSSSAFWGAAMRYRSLTNVRIEIQKYKQSGYKIFNILDDNFNLNKTRLKEFCKIASEEKINWKTNCCVSAFEAGMVESMIASGCIGLSIGVESADEDVQKKTGKLVDLQQAENIVKKANQLGIKVVCGFILFHYCDTSQSLQKTIDFAKKLTSLGAIVRYTINTPFHGTYQYQHRYELGIKIIDENYEHYNLQQAVINTKNFKNDYMDELRLTLNNDVIDINFLESFMKKNNITDSTQITTEMLQQIIKGALK
ncbi:MAG: radical SAM protein [Candidatus Margulisbacteria bacterium]|nr:radical SAM protein [Candidatus Margulisiibacteriota bacterium]